MQNHCHKPESSGYILVWPPNQNVAATFWFSRYFLVYVPSCQLARYLTCSGVSVSILTPVAANFSAAIF